MHTQTNTCGSRIYHKVLHHMVQEIECFQRLRSFFHPFLYCRGSSTFFCTVVILCTSLVIPHAKHYDLACFLNFIIMKSCNSFFVKLMYFAHLHCCRALSYILYILSYIWSAILQNLYTLCENIQVISPIWGDNE